jgi:hypothetical protein
MSPTLDVFHCLVTNLSTLRWTISNWPISPLLHGSQAEQAYSSGDLVRCLYAWSFTEVELMLRFRRRKSNVLFAFVQTLFTWHFIYIWLLDKDIWFLLSVLAAFNWLKIMSDCHYNWWRRLYIYLALIFILFHFLYCSSLFLTSFFFISYVIQGNSSLCFATIYGISSLISWFYLF